MSDPSPPVEPPAEPPAESGYDEDEPRRYPSTIGGLFYLVVLTTMGLGIGIVWNGDWRHGVTWIGSGLLLAALVRLLLRTRDAGMLAVRHRAMDTLLLSSVGAALIFLARTIPNQPV